jgi:hypothetical protein
MELEGEVRSRPKVPLSRYFTDASSGSPSFL